MKLKSRPTSTAALGLTAGLVVLLLLAGCGSGGSAPTAGGAPQGQGQSAGAPANPELQSLVGAARAEGQLQLVWGEGTVGGPEGSGRLASGFNRA